MSTSSPIGKAIVAARDARRRECHGGASAAVRGAAGARRPPSCVAVVVDFRQLGGSVQTGCAQGDPSTGLQALSQGRLRLHAAAARRVDLPDRRAAGLHRHDDVDLLVLLVPRGRLVRTGSMPAKVPAPTTRSPAPPRAGCGRTAARTPPPGTGSRVDLPAAGGNAVRNAEADQDETAQRASRPAPRQPPTAAGAGQRFDHDDRARATSKPSPKASSADRHASRQLGHDQLALRPLSATAPPPTDRPRRAGPRPTTAAAAVRWAASAGSRWAARLSSASARPPSSAPVGAGRRDARADSCRGRCTRARGGCGPSAWRPPRRARRTLICCCSCSRSPASSSSTGAATRPWARAYGFYLRMGLVVIAIRVVFACVFGVPQPGPSSSTCPRSSLPRLGGRRTARR